MSEILGTLVSYLVRIFAVGTVIGLLWLAFGGNKVTKAVSDTSTATANIENTYSLANNNFSSLTNTTVIGGGWAPGMLNNGTLINPWKGTVTFTVDTNPLQFDMTSTQIPQDACTQYVEGVQGYVSLSINGNQVATNAAPLDPATATTACTAGGASNTVEFVFN